MKNFKKIMLLVLCAALLMGISVMGTLAYLKAQTGTIENTFVTGKVGITLREYDIKDDGSVDRNTVLPANSGLSGIKLIPGRTIEKIPFITVTDGSENSYLFVEVVNGLNGCGTLNMADGWEQLDNSNIWYYNTVKNTGSVEVFESFVCDNTIEEYNASFDGAKITVTAYAVQAEGFANAQAAWAATFGASSNGQNNNG